MITEQEWMTCADPHPMLELLRAKASDRKLRLFAVDTEQKKSAICGRLESARRFAFSSIVSLAKPFSSCFLRCLVHVSLSSPWPRLSQAVSFAV